MKIVVCVNHVPDTTTRINVSSGDTRIETDSATYVINPYDEFAVEEALKTKELMDCNVTAISVGADANKETLRKVLAMGVDDALLLKTNLELDSIAVAKILADEIKNQNAELVFMGKQSVDYDNSIMGQLVATLLDYNVVSSATSFTLNENVIIAEREIEGGKETIETSLPLVVTTQKGLNTPRYASIKGIMGAKRKTIGEKEINVTEFSSTPTKIRIPITRKVGRIIGNGAEAVPKLLSLLKEEAKVI